MLSQELKKQILYLPFPQRVCRGFLFFACFSRWLFLRLISVVIIVSMCTRFAWHRGQMLCLPTLHWICWGYHPGCRIVVSLAIVAMVSFANCVGCLPSACWGYHPGVAMLCRSTSKLHAVHFVLAWIAWGVLCTEKRAITGKFLVKYCYLFFIAQTATATNRNRRSERAVLCAGPAFRGPSVCRQSRCSSDGHE
jgi:hypothetical protein